MFCGTPPRCRSDRTRGRNGSAPAGGLRPGWRSLPASAGVRWPLHLPAFRQCRFTDQQVGVSRQRDQIFGVARVAGIDQALACRSGQAKGDAFRVVFHERCRYHPANRQTWSRPAVSISITVAEDRRYRSKCHRRFFSRLKKSEPSAGHYGERDRCGHRPGYLVANRSGTSSAVWSG